VDLIEVGGAFSFSGLFHHAVAFLSSAAHVTLKVAEGAWDAVAGDDIRVLRSSAPLPLKALAAVDLATTVVSGADAAKLLEVGAKGAAKAGGERAAFALVRWIAKKTGLPLNLTDDVLRDAFRARKTGGGSAVRRAEDAAASCIRRCFAAGTLVATAQGATAIESLHVGTVVLAEDPTSGQVEGEPVTAVLRDPVKALLAVDLSDGSAITTTADRTMATSYDGDNRAVRSVSTSSDESGTTGVTTTNSDDPNGDTLGTTMATQKPDGTVETHTSAGAYDAAGNATSASDDSARTSYGYDAAGQQRSETGGDGLTAALGYDSAGRVTAVTDTTGAAGPYVTGYTYNANSLPLTVLYPNGTRASLGYDANSALTRLTATGPAQTPATTTLQSGYGYGYNAAGWIVSSATLSGAATLTHDASGRLIDECGPQMVTPSHCDHWTYNRNGNVLMAVGDSVATDVYTYTVARTPGGQINEQVAGGSSDSPPTATIRLAYDAHGDTTSISNAVAQTPNSSDPGYKKYAIAESFAYDAQQRPIIATRLDSTRVGTQTIVTPLTATLQYNADGLRSDYYLTPDPRTGKTTVDTRFAYRGGELASATVPNMTGTLLYKNTFVYGPSGEPLELIRTDPTGTSRYWYALDGLGNVVALTDINGKVVDRYAYDSWGEETSNDATDETVPQQLRYQGYYYDEKLTYY